MTDTSIETTPNPPGQDTQADNTSQAISAPGDVHPLVAAQPDRYLELRNGAIYDRQIGRIVKNQPDKNPHAITKENSREMHQLRRAQTIDATLRGIEAGTGMQTWTGGVERMAAAMAQYALAEKAKSVDAYLALMRTIDVLPTRDRADDAGSGNVIIPDAVMLRILDALRGRDSSETIIDAEYSDITSTE